VIAVEERGALEALLGQMRSLHEELSEHSAGVCLLHLEAAVAALESHLRRSGASAADELRLGLAAEDGA
jgi:hypothetical protein